MILHVCIAAYAQGGAGKTQTDPLSSGQSYVLGPGDQIVLQASNADEISGKAFRIEADGTIDFPLLGKMHPGGQTIEQFEGQVINELAAYVREPQLTLSVSQFRSETVTLSGAFRTPGVYSLQGRHTITEMLAVAGGLAENASRILKITRQVSPGAAELKGGRMRGDGMATVIGLDVTPVITGINPGDEFVLEPNDMITAFANDPIVVSGEVLRAGMVPLGGRKSIPLLEVIMLSGGTTREAGRKRIKIYRPVPDSTHNSEIDVDLEKIQRGVLPDVAVLPRDLVVVPRSESRAVSKQIVTLTTGLALSVIAALVIAGH
jgi:polysaccharide export outer membrane protein